MNLAETVRAFFPESSAPRSVLVTGSGPDRMPEWEQNGIVPTYLDIESRNKPDILADMCDMRQQVPCAQYDVVFCCHALEHCYPHQVWMALTEARRVLRPGGVLVILVPDLEDVKPTEDVLELPQCGPITGLHLFYGNACDIEQFPHMAHHCGFIAETLESALRAAGFKKYKTERLPRYNLLGIGVKIPKTPDEQFADELCGIVN